MRSLGIAALLALGMVATGPAESALVQGATSGAFTSLTGTVSPSNQWNFITSAPNESSLLFTGASFGLASTPLTFSLGSLLLSNGGNGGLGTGSYTADLNIGISFSTPAGQNVSFLDTLTLEVDNGSGGAKVAITNLPGAQMFTVGADTYTVTFNGMFTAASGGTDITVTGLSVANPGNPNAPDNTGTAYLRATVTAQGSTTPSVSAIPEPTTLALLGLGLVGLAAARRREQ